MLINSRDLHVETYGPDSGSSVIFLHHGLGSTRAWRKQVPAFVKAGYRVIVYDRWGYGRSQVRSHFAFPGFEDDIADLHVLIETFDRRPLTLIGHSDGGTIALYYAAQNPKQVNALVTVSAHIYLEPKMEPSIQVVQRDFEEESRLRKSMKRNHGDKFESTFYNWFNGWHTPSALEWDMRPLLSKIHCPTLVIQGENDEHATPQHAANIANNIAGAELWFVPDANHMLPVEMKEEFNHSVISFLQRVI